VGRQRAERSGARGQAARQLNLAFEGRRFAPTLPYRVGREKIREFADAIGVEEPAHRDPEAARALGHPDVIAPPTFPVVITMPVSRMIADEPDLGLDYSRVVHAEQRFTYTRPVFAGDELTCTAELEKLTSRAGLDSVMFRVEIATVAGEPVATVWTKLVARAEG
jgi:acyl dehydratase